MEAEILKVLQEIRGLLFITAIAISIGVVFWIFSSGSLLLAAIKAAFSKDWKEQAIEYFDKGMYEQLLAHCLERLKTHKNDANAYYWQARVYHAKGDDKKASEFFQIVSKMAPDWHKEFVEPFTK